MKIRAVAATLLFTAACLPSTPNSGQDPAAPGQTARPPRVPFVPLQPIGEQVVALTTFSGSTACADLEQHLEDRAVFEMRLNVERSKESALQSYDCRTQQYCGWYGSDAGVASGSAAGGGTASSGAGGAAGGGTGSSAPTDFTTTNTQLEGIDEPDIIKNDGTRLFVVSGRRLFTVTTWPAAALATRGSIELGGKPFELFLAGDRVVVFSHVLEASFGLPSYCQQYDCSSWYSNATLITHLDVSDLAHPVVLATQRVPGRYESARRVGPTMRVVTTSSLPAMTGLQTWIDWNTQQEAQSRSELAALFDRLADFNEGRIRSRTLAEWIPGALISAGGATSTTALDCEGISTTNVAARLGLTNIVTLDVTNPHAFSRQALLAAVDELYQGPESLYLSQRHWSWSSTVTDRTYLYRFDLSQADRVTFVAAGAVEGHALNQFSFDEHQGVLRMAVTVGWWGTLNRVVTFGTRNGALVELGRTPDLAPGERIMSARFLGEKAYVVTFRQVDPLYVIDLSDPTNPVKVGELKIPGFSSYIHPLGPNHLLTIGTYIPEPPAQQWTRHLQLQIFDVSNPAAPRQAFTQLVGEAWGWSEAQWNHKAFNYFPAKGLLAVPFADSSYRDGTYRFVSDLRVFHVDAQTGFTAKGILDVGDLLNQGCTSGCWSWWWEPHVRRSVMADDFVYAITSGGVRVAHVEELDAPLATAPFTAAP